MKLAGFRPWLAGVLIAAGLLLSGPAARAQLAPDSARLAVRLAAARLLVNAYELEVEYRLASRFSVVVAPRLTAGTVPAIISSQSHEAGDRVRGAGVGVSGRLYVPGAETKDSKLTGFYVSLKAEYQRLRLRYEQEVWTEFLASDGLRYYAYRPQAFRETIDRVGGALALGYQCQALHPRLRLDASAGLNGLVSRSSAGAASHYRTSVLDYGASDIFGSINIGFGLVLK